jgi:hypothetical protein
VEGSPQLIVDGLPALIPNASLTQSDIPDIDVRTLPGDAWLGGPGAGERWELVWAFALTFAGWKHFGGDEHVIPRLGAFDESIRRAYERDGQLPAIDLALLRACLFYEQRLLCKHSMLPPDEQRKAYLQALLDGIRGALS